PHQIKKNSDAKDAVTLYRKILAKQNDNSVVIITVGFLTNIANLLQSKPDAYSPLNGVELVKKKVKKMVSMGGKFPAGKEFNLFKDIKASQYAFAHFPKPVYFSGFEIGEQIKCGLPLVHNDKIQHNPVKDVFRICLPQAAEDSAGRKSWDEVTTLIAITGYQPYYNAKEGSIVIADDGSNTWNQNGKNQYYLVDKNAALLMQKKIDELMMHLPK
ncbi:MAG: nucleoside hydrolase, partial [Bacteroidota bacterium]|nr:nucleoside hydrolase [Bacteroidota bacterium]